MSEEDGGLEMMTGSEAPSVEVTRKFKWRGIDERTRRPVDCEAYEIHTFGLRDYRCVTAAELMIMLSRGLRIRNATVATSQNGTVYIRTSSNVPLVMSRPS